MADENALSFDEKIEFLSSLEIFEGLTEAELAGLARISGQYAFSNGAVVIHQGDVADKLFIVEDGRLEAVTINKEGVSRRVTQYLPHTWFEDVWLFNPGTHPCSIKAKQDGRLLIIDSNAFLNFLNTNKAVLSKLVLSDAAIDELEKTPLTKAERRYKRIRLVPGELVELETPRSRWLLATKLFLPSLGLVAVPALIYWTMTTAFENLGMNWVWFLMGLFAFAFLLVIAFQWLDWANDYLVITNKRLVHIEFDLRSLSAKGKDTLFDQIQSVETVIPNFFSNLLNLGTARVTTAAQTVLFFDYLNNPERVKITINDIRGRKRSMSDGEFKATMRKSVENYFQIPDALMKLKEDMPPLVDKTTALGRSWKQVRKFRLYRYRFEEGNTITYRKHVFALFVELLWPMGVALVLAVFAIVLNVLQVDQYMGFIIVGGLLDMLWFIWRTEDWRNDTFQVTERYVIDIDRRPFGFGESRKQAQLDNIQEVEADRPNFLATIFNFGNVEVETAGADSNIIFENVSNPTGVKNDIFKKRSKFQDMKRKNQAEQQRREYAVLLDVFMQEREMDRVNRRTPDFENALDALVDTMKPDDE
ncbi:MAG: cyclic nucleotide-binding domain-containing protein [Anaerolineales bacterium]|nr:cyclic nucleotide-binding domain-containing protein [Anaerolineales bacterium]